MRAVLELENLGYVIALGVNGTIILKHYSPSAVPADQKAYWLEELKLHKAEAIAYLRRKAPVVAIDLETTGLDPVTNSIELVSYADKQGSEVFNSPEHLKEVLADPEVIKVFHNAAFDVRWLNHYGYAVNSYEDTMLMAQVMTNNGEHSLKALANQHLRVELDKTLQKPENRNRSLFAEEEQAAFKEYAKKDAEVTLKLFYILKKELAKTGLEQVYERELAALPAVIRLCRDGIAFDRQAWQADLAQYTQHRDSLEKEIKAELQTGINLASPKQLLDCLRNRGLPVQSTNDESLAVFESEMPVLSKLRKWRELNKLCTSFGRELLSSVNNTGRIHASWKLIGTVTGRMTCRDPNLQQVPHVLRKYFRAPKGRVLVIADYSQIELRVAAELAQDGVMLKAFKKGEDLHAKTAKMILKKQDVTKEERQVAKTANFGLIYGMTGKGLQVRVKTLYGLDLPEQEAEAFRQGFFKLYPGIRQWQETQIETGEVRTKGGRVWWDLPKPPDYGWRNRLNYPVQGTAAEGLKEALVLLIKKLSAEWKLVAVVHDEVVLEVPEAKAEEAEGLLQDCMVSGMRRLLTLVPVVVAVAVSETWLKEE